MEDLFGDEADAGLARDDGDRELSNDKTRATDVQPAYQHDAEREEEVEDDLFGEEENQADSPTKEHGTEADAEDDVDAAEEQIITSFQVANYKTPGAGIKDIYLAKLPSFLDVNSLPHDAEALLTEIQQAAAESADNDEKITKKRSLVNTLRWKFEHDEDGNRRKVSNARFVQWSDGSVSLQVGEELFDVPTKSISKDHSYLTLMHPEDGILRGMRRFTKSMNFQPYGLSSKSHEELKADIARRSITSKSRTVKVHATLINPEQMQKDAIKAESERLKARRRLDSQKARAMNYNGTRDRTRLTANYLDDSEEELGDGSGPRRGGYLDDNDDGFVENDEDDEELEAGAGRLQALKDAGAQQYKINKTKKRSRSQGSDELEDSEDESIVYEDDAENNSEEEEEAVMTPKEGRSPTREHEQSIDEAEAIRTKKLKRRIVESDEDEDE